MHCFITVYHETRKSFQLQVTNNDLDVIVKNLRTAMAYLMLINYIEEIRCSKLTPATRRI